MRFSLFIKSFFWNLYSFCILIFFWLFKIKIWRVLWHLQKVLKSKMAGVLKCLASFWCDVTSWLTCDCHQNKHFRMLYTQIKKAMAEWVNHNSTGYCNIIVIWSGLFNNYCTCILLTVTIIFEAIKFKFKFIISHCLQKI